MDQDSNTCLGPVLSCPVLWGVGVHKHLKNEMIIMKRRDRVAAAFPLHALKVAFGRAVAFTTLKHRR